MGPFKPLTNYNLHGKHGRPPPSSCGLMVPCFFFRLYDEALVLSSFFLPVDARRKSGPPTFQRSLACVSPPLQSDDEPCFFSLLVAFSFGAPPPLPPWGGLFSGVSLPVSEELFTMLVFCSGVSGFHRVLRLGKRFNAFPSRAFLVAVPCGGLVPSRASFAGNGLVP